MFAEVKKETFCNAWFHARNPVEKEGKNNVVPLVCFLPWLLPSGRIGRDEGADMAQGEDQCPWAPEHEDGESEYMCRS